MEALLGLPLAKVIHYSKTPIFRTKNDSIMWSIQAVIYIFISLANFKNKDFLIIIMCCVDLLPLTLFKRSEHTYIYVH